MVFKYPQEVHDFVKENCKKLRDDDLASACNEKFGTAFNARKMKAFRSNYKYYNGRKQWTKEEYWKYQKRYPQGMYEYIRDNSWGVSSKEMAERCNEKFGTKWTQTGMKQFRARHGIKSGCTGWYQKAHVPGTKGKTIEEICKYDPEKIARVRATYFKKGGRPMNEMPVGTIVVNSYGYKLRKKQMEGSIWERWEFLHRAVWEESNGPIPDGMFIIFKDHNKLNCNIDNLVLINRAENCMLNNMNLRSEDPDLTMAGIQLVRLKHAIRVKKNENRTQNKADRKNA